ncbi:MAG: MmcQ/YjbR family DNA-binding protein [Acidobacteriaceae bacterium]|jgi:hypothetical protein
MSAGVDRFRAMALSLPGAVESAHMGNPDFRVGGRIFATLSGQARGRGVLKLTVEQQAEFVGELPEVFEPVQGGWGRMGMTYLVLDRADAATMLGALTVAHRNVAAKQAQAKAKAKPAKRRAR